MFRAFKHLQWFNQAKVLGLLLISLFVAPPWLCAAWVMMARNITLVSNNFDIGVFFGTIFITLLTVMHVAGALAPLYLAICIIEKESTTR